MREIRQSPHRCGFCNTPSTKEPHAHCPVAVLNGNGETVIRCGCPCTAHIVKCMDCGLREFEGQETDLQPGQWRCADPDDCKARIEKRLAADPVVQMIRKIHENSEKRVRTERTSTTTRATSGVCLHCDTPTKGGMFAPGHDAAFLSTAAKLIKDPESPSTLEETLASWESFGVSEALRAKLTKRVSA